MLGWALAFFVIAIVAGAIGFAGAVSAAAGVAQVFFWVFVFLFAISLVAGLPGARRSVR